jgi:hypothetical protein
MMVEHQMATIDVWKIGRDVSGLHGHLAVLHVFGVHEQDVVNHPQFFEQSRANQAIEITSGHQPMFSCHTILQF